MAHQEAMKSPSTFVVLYIALQEQSAYQVSPTLT